MVDGSMLEEEVADLDEEEEAMFGDTELLLVVQLFE